MGDNVTYNDKLARLLGVNRLKCLSHALALVFKDFTSVFPTWEDATTKLGGIVSSGGSSAKKAELRKVGVDWTKLSGYPNRWGSTSDAAAFLLSDSSPVVDAAAVGLFVAPLPKRVICVIADKLYEWDADSDSEDEENGIDNAAAMAARREGMAVKRRLAALFSEETGSAQNLAIEIGVVLAATENIPSSITRASANTGNVGEDFLDQIHLIERSLIRAMNPATAPFLVNAAHARSPFKRTPLQLAATTARLTPLIVEAATKAHLKFLKHIPDAIIFLKWRRLYDPRVKPTAYSGSLEVEAMSAYFGCEPDEATLGLVDQWALYVERWDDIPAAEKAGVHTGSMREFWERRQVCVWGVVGHRFPFDAISPHPYPSLPHSSPPGSSPIASCQCRAWRRRGCGMLRFRPHPLVLSGLSASCAAWRWRRSSAWARTRSCKSSCSASTSRS